MLILILQNGIGDMDYFETEMVDTNSSILVNYGVNYILGATVSFDQARSPPSCVLPVNTRCIHQLCAGEPRGQINVGCAG